LLGQCTCNAMKHTAPLPPLVNPGSAPNDNPACLESKFAISCFRSTYDMALDDIRGWYCQCASLGFTREVILALSCLFKIVDCICLCYTAFDNLCN